MGLLSGADILAAEDTVYEDVDCPAWGGTVRVRSLSSAEREALLDSVYVEGDDGEPEFDRKTMRAKTVVACAVGADGKPLFTAADVDALGGKSANMIERIFRAANRVNGISQDAVEDAVKN